MLMQKIAEVFPKKSLDPVLAPKVNRMTIFSIVFNKKNEGL